MYNSANDFFLLLMNPVLICTNECTSTHPPPPPPHPPPRSTPFFLDHRLRSQHPPTPPPKSTVTPYPITGCRWLLWRTLIGAIPMVTMGQRAANWCNTHTHMSMGHRLCKPNPTPKNRRNVQSQAGRQSTALQELVEDVDVSGGHVGVRAGLVQETLTHVVVQFGCQVGRGRAQVSVAWPPPHAGHAQQVPQQRQHVQHNLLGFPVVHSVRQNCTHHTCTH